MRIVFFGINYHPELTGIGKYNTELCEALVDQNHRVDVITAYPYYPHWKVQEPYKPYSWQSECINKVQIRRAPFYIPKKISGFKRILHELSFVLGCIPYTLYYLFKKVDLVLCIYPPLISLPLPFLLARLKGVPIVLHVQDLQVDAARDLNIITNKKLLMTLEKIEKFFFSKTSVITTISEGMRERIRKKAPGIKTQIFRNWVDTGIFHPLEIKGLGLKEKYGFHPSDIVLLYSGNIGEKQGLETVLEAAGQLQDNPAYKFLILGEGAAKERLVQTAEAMKLKNVQFGSLVPKNQLNELLNMADYHLITQKKGSSDLVMPSKLGPILAVGGISIIGGDLGSTIHRLVKENKFGFFFEAEDTTQLLQIIKSQSADQKKLNELKRNAREFSSNLDSTKVLGAFGQFLSDLV